MIGLVLQSRPGCTIVETGTVREPGNWAGDGQSTVVWDTFAAEMGGTVTTIDVDPHCAEVVAQLGLTHTTALTGDSLTILPTLTGPVDLLYLDSMDINWSNPGPSSEHHLAELVAADHLLGPGTIVAVDDNAHGTGKGEAVAAEMARRGVQAWMSNYVRAWRL